MQLIIVRHAQAFAKEEDPARSLNPQGKAQAQKLNAFLKNHDLIIKKVFHSNKARAKQTAEILAKDLPGAPPVEVLGALDPEGDINQLAQATDYFTDNTVIVGHIPHVELLSNLLLSGNYVRPVTAFDTAAMMCFKKDQNIWVLQWFVSPALI